MIRLDGFVLLVLSDKTIILGHVFLACPARDTVGVPMILISIIDSRRALVPKVPLPGSGRCDKVMKGVRWMSRR